MSDEANELFEDLYREFISNKDKATIKSKCTAIIESYIEEIEDRLYDLWSNK